MSVKDVFKSGLVSGFRLPPVRHMAQKIASDNALIFMLHRFQDNDRSIEGHDPKFLAQCLEELHRLNYKLVSVDDIVEAHLQGIPIKNAVAFTVDDGYLDHYQVGGDIFSRYDCPATFYVISDFLDDDYWPEDAKVKYLFEHTQIEHIDWSWNGFSLNSALDNKQQRKSAAESVIWSAKELPIAQMQLATSNLAAVLKTPLPERAPAKYRPMTWDNARDLEKRGMRIGAHTCRHVTLSKEDNITASTEIMNSFASVKRQIANPSSVFCYPTGRPQDFGQREIDMLNNGEFKGAVSTNSGYFNSRDNDQLFTMPRMSMPDNIVDFRKVILYLEYFQSRFNPTRR
jgi:peptidoglycan/xylan/chitin deacetylase (PgdA/CDA1 family)